MATKYPWAPITPYGASILPTDTYWFVESQMSKLDGPTLLELSKHVQIVDILDDPSRDWRMVAVHALGESTVPKEVMMKVGQVQTLPEGMSLGEVKTDLYGGEFLEPMGAFEWFAVNYPAGIQTMIDTVSGVKDIAKGFSIGFGAIAAMALGGWVALRLLDGGRK